MTEAPDVQAIADQIHELAETLMEKGACPTCVAKVLVSEGCYLGQHIGALDIAKAVTDIYEDEPPPSTH